MNNYWIVLTTEAVRRSRARIKELRVTTAICHHPDAVHRLPGEHGKRVLAAVAERWNASGFVASHNFNRCRADFLTEASRKNFTLSLSR